MQSASYHNNNWNRCLTQFCTDTVMNFSAALLCVVYAVGHFPSSSVFHLSVIRERVLWKNGWLDRGAVWDGGRVGWVQGIINIRRTCTLAPPGKYVWTIVCGGYELVCTMVATRPVPRLLWAVLLYCNNDIFDAGIQAPFYVFWIIYSVHQSFSIYCLTCNAFATVSILWPVCDYARVF